MMNLDDELDNKEPVSKKRERERERKKEKKIFHDLLRKKYKKKHPPIHHLLNRSILVENFKNVEKSVKLSLGELL